LERCLALRFLSRQNRLTLSFRLQGNLRQPVLFRLTRGLGRLGGKTGGELCLFLALALSLFLLALLFFRQSLLDPQPRLFPGLSARSGKIPVFGPVQVGPRVEGGYILRSLGDLALGFGIGYTHRAYLPCLPIVSFPLPLQPKPDAHSGIDPATGLTGQINPAPVHRKIANASYIRQSVQATGPSNQLLLGRA
jgi:hypothetical protein